MSYKEMVLAMIKAVNDGNKQEAIRIAKKYAATQKSSG